MRGWVLVAIVRLGLCPEIFRPGESIELTTGTHLNKFRACQCVG
jgi:hypothetical protein